MVAIDELITIATTRVPVTGTAPGSNTGRAVNFGNGRSAAEHVAAIFWNSLSEGARHQKTPSTIKKPAASYGGYRWEH